MPWRVALQYVDREVVRHVDREVVREVPVEKEVEKRVEVPVEVIKVRPPQTIADKSCAHAVR